MYNVTKKNQKQLEIVVRKIAFKEAAKRTDTNKARKRK
jgi:hypothetical protein